VAGFADAHSGSRVSTVRLHLAAILIGLVAATSAGGEESLPNAAAECDLRAASDLDVERPTAVEGVPSTRVDATLAIPACEAAVKAAPGGRRVVYQLGRAYFAAKDYVPACARYAQAAEWGHVGATHNLGVCFLEGLDRPGDPAKAKQLFEQGAANGLSVSMHVIGGLYELGRGVPIDLDIALDWYRRALDRGFAPSAAGIERIGALKADAQREKQAAAYRATKTERIGDKHPEGDPTTLEDRKETDDEAIPPPLGPAIKIIDPFGELLRSKSENVVGNRNGDVAHDSLRQQRTPNPKSRKTDR
jgi:TPR repeat protein